MSKLSEEARSLQEFINRMITMKVPNIDSRDSRDMNGASAERITEVPVNEANVVTSRSRAEGDTHMVVLDIDHPAWLVRSSTPEHYHLYIDVPGGIPAKDYSDLLVAMANAGILQPGYVGASQARGFTAVRLPWVKKEQSNG